MLQVENLKAIIEVEVRFSIDQLSIEAFVIS